MTNKTVVFILAHNYSGSTWLSLLLGSHSEAFYLGELNKFYSRSDPMNCALCDMLKQRCPYFFDVHNHHPRDIHAVIFQRTGKRLLVDNSKRIKWARKFQGEDRYQIRYIHLIKDPRAIYYSLLVRNRPATLDKWIRRNLEIQEFIRASGRPAIVVPYNQLAGDLDRTLPAICRWLGLEFEPEQKNYWQFEHHGPGKNGATAAFVAGGNGQEMEFYQKNFQRNFLDLRWKEKLPQEVIQRIEADPQVREVLVRLQLHFTDQGIEAARGSILAGETEVGR
ncbi:MAG: hypothetical protein D6715_09320 [Calditrichaeota bacterium]|nr:MAG: hypothetical protein D6715_09320 [Calditrichota bacterium]